MYRIALWREFQICNSKSFLQNRVKRVLSLSCTFIPTNSCFAHFLSMKRTSFWLQFVVSLFTNTSTNTMFTDYNFIHNDVKQFYVLVESYYQFTDKILYRSFSFLIQPKHKHLLYLTLPKFRKHTRHSDYKLFNYDLMPKKSEYTTEMKNSIYLIRGTFIQLIMSERIICVRIQKALTA